MGKQGALIWMLKAVTITTVGITSISLIDNMVKQTKEEHTVEYEPVIMYYTVHDNSMAVPEGDTSFKSYMDYRAITNTRSEQWKMQQTAYTDGGIRRYKNGDYMVAMGSYYGEVGDRFHVTLDTGETFDVVMGDAKADSDTDRRNQYTPCGGGKNVIEFIVDTSELPREARRMGDVSYADDIFEGNVEKIERIEE